MGWEDRPYASGDCCDDSNVNRGGGARSWLGGLPPPGKAVRWIMIANAAMFVLCLMTGGAGSRIYQALEMRTDRVLHGEIWRLFTFTYLHDQGSPMHIFWNMLALYMLGTILETAWGHRKFFVMYTVGGFVAVLAYLVLTVAGWLREDIALVGASGGVLTVLGACAVLFPHIRLFMFFPVPIRAAVLLFTVMYVMNLLMRGANAGGDACHLAGMAFGVAWGYRGERWLMQWRGLRGGLKYRAAEPRVIREPPEEALQEEVDRILDKVHHHGVASLTRREKEILEAATRSRQRAQRS